MSSNDSDNNSENGDNQNSNNDISITGAQSTDYLYSLFTNPSLLITLSIIILVFYLKEE